MDIKEMYEKATEMADIYYKRSELGWAIYKVGFVAGIKYIQDNETDKR